MYRLSGRSIPLGGDGDLRFRIVPGVHAAWPPMTLVAMMTVVVEALLMTLVAVAEGLEVKVFVAVTQTVTGSSVMVAASIPPKQEQAEEYAATLEHGEA